MTLATPNKTTRWLFLLGLLLSCSWISCDKSDDCFQPSEVLLRVSFTQKDVIRGDTLIDSILVDTTIVRYRDTLFPSPVLLSLDLVPAIKITGSPFDNFIGLLLNPDTNRTTYSLQFDSTKTLRDTFSIFYKSKVHFISNACGFTNYFEIDSVRSTHHLIDSVGILTQEVSLNAGERHVGFYFFHQ